MMRKNIKNQLYIVLLTATLVSCGTTEEVRYRDTAMLERPPTLVTYSAVEKENKIVDSAEPEAEAKTGLGTNVYMSGSNSSLLIIKQSFDEAWNTFAQALKQQELEITDRNREEGAYYVTYDPDSYQSGGIFSFFNDEYIEEGYLLKLTPNGAETEITAEVVNQPGPDSLEDNERPVDGAEKLLISLYKTLHDDLKKK